MVVYRKVSRKEKTTIKLLVISLDAMGDHVFESMASQPHRYPNIAALKNRLTYRNQVRTVFVSNTYPIHTSISTGKVPGQHGITSNTHPTTGDWIMSANRIHSKTLWQAAREKKLKTAAFLWPVTCGAPINWHLPEVHLKKGQSRLVEQLRQGSKAFQIQALIKHKHLLGNLADVERSQPALDNFTTAVACDLFARKKTPDLALVHLIAYDHICHATGPEPVGERNTDRLETAKQAMDTNLGKLLDSWQGNVLIFSDHSQLQVNETINLNTLYRNTQFLQLGGSAFGTTFDISLPDQHWFGRHLSKEEMAESGYSGKYTFGFAAKPGFSFGEKEVSGDHGYPTDYANYQTFYGIDKPLPYLDKLRGSVLDITAIIAKELGLDMDIVASYGL